MKINFKKLLGNLVLLFIVLAFCIIIIEFTIYTLGLANIVSFRQSDDTIHHILKPNSTGRFIVQGDFEAYYYINSMGFRDSVVRDVDYSKKDPNEFRIVFVGDSFTEGFGLNYSDTFEQLLEKRLNKEYPEKKWVVINAGVASYSPLFENLLIKTKIISLKPDLVILDMDQGDFNDDYKWSLPENAQLDEKGLPVRIYPQKTSPIKDFSRRHSYIANLLAKHSVLSDPFGKKAAALVDYEKDHLGDLRYDLLAVMRSDDAPKQNEDIINNKSKLYLRDIHNELSKNNISFLFTMFPYGVQISTHEWSIGRKQYHFDNDTLYSTKIFDVMEDFSKETNICFLSTYPAFKSSNLSPLFYDHDPHFTKNGAKVMANSIYEKLISNNFCKNGYESK